MANRKPPSDPPPIKSNPFAVLSDLRVATSSTDHGAPGNPAPAPAKPDKNRGRVDILRSTAHRGGKTVTVIRGFQAVATTELDQLAKRLQKTCGAGGTALAAHRIRNVFDYPSR